MNPLGELLGVDNIRLGVAASDRTRVLELVAELLASRHALSRTAVLESLTGRERLGSTGVGHGVAIPHARMNQCTAAAAAFVRAKTAVPFDAPDGRPVSVFVGLIVPNTANERHLKLLATAAGMLSDKGFREKLKTCADVQEALRLLAAWPDTPGSGSP
jgi:nitrogen PTS system EIIA component